MDIPIDKKRNWITCLYEGMGCLDEDAKSTVMKPSGRACAGELLLLCERQLRKKVTSVRELVEGWNMVRDKRGLKGKWEFEGDTVSGVFNECGCPLVRSGLVKLHPVQCYCSQSMMETIFSTVSGRPVEVKIIRSIGRGDGVCEFVVRPGE